MPGGLLNIAAYGAENIILTGNPTKTYFKATYKKYANFGLQRFRIDYKGQRVLNYNSETELDFKIPRYAELLWDTYLVINLPDIWSPFFWKPDIEGCLTPFEFKWIDQLGSMMIKQVTIYSGSNTLAQYSGEYLSVIMERDDLGKRKLWNKMIGDRASYTNPAYAYQNGGFYPNANYQKNPPAGFTGADVEPSIKGGQLYIPLEAWFCYSGGKTALPLVALQYQEVSIKIQFRPIKELYTILDVANPSKITGKGKRIAPCPASLTDQLWWFLQPPQDASGVIVDESLLTPQQNQSLGRYIRKNNWDADIHLVSTYVFLSNEERRMFASQSQNYIIKDVYEHDFLNVAGSKRVDIPSRNMVSSYSFRFRRSDVQERNEWFNYTNWSYENIQEAQLREMSPVCPNENALFVPYNFMQTAPMTNSSNLKMILLDMGILLGAEYRENVLQSGIYNYVEKWARTSGVAKDGIYMYNFAIKTNRNYYQPSGAQNTNKWQYVTFEFNTIQPPINPDSNVEVLCDPSGAIIGIRKDAVQLNKWNYDLRVFEERYNMVIIESGRIGLLNAR